MIIDSNITNQHKQLEQASCIPMSVELVLKLTNQVDSDYYEQQKNWHNKKKYGDFRDYNGETIKGLTFSHRFSPNDRGRNFSLDKLFDEISDEIRNQRFVIISLEVSQGWHNYVIYNQLSTGEFEAVTQGGVVIKNVKEQVNKMQGTDILIYRHDNDSAPHS